jgi:hypothetical protein
MEMNDKRKKQLWIGAAVVAGLYFAPSIISHVSSVVTPSKTAAAMHPKPSPAVPMAVVPAVQAPSPAAQLALLSGKYGGDGLVKTRQCKMELELNPPDPQGNYTAYTSVTCFSPSAIIGMTPSQRANGAMGLANQFTPAGAVLSGSVVDGAIKLKTNKSIETLADGCPITGLSIVGFGLGRIAVDWDENGCPGGQLILQRR